jgi:non-ribosomal peptide synthetase component F
LQRELALELRELAAAGETTLFVLLLAAFYILLARFIEQEDILVGTPAAGRKHADLNRIIGMFVNTLVLRNRLGSNKIFSAFLREVRQSVLAAFENQDYPLERLINRLQVPKISGRNPLFDILFVSENTDIPRLELENLEMFPYKMEHRISHLDLVIYVVEEGDDVTIAVEYATYLYKTGSIRRFGEHYIEILEQLKEKAGRPMGEIKISHEFEQAKSMLHAEKAEPFNF